MGQEKELRDEGDRIEGRGSQPIDKQVTDIHKEAEGNLTDLPQGAERLIEGVKREVKEDNIAYEKQLKLFDKARKGDEKARMELIEANKRLVYWVVSRMQSQVKAKQDKFEAEDFVSFGFRGLIDAVDNFDSKRGHFSTCAEIYIKGHILRGIDEEGRLIRLPVGWSREYARLRKFEKRMESDRGRKVSWDEVIEEAVRTDYQRFKFAEVILKDQSKPQAKEYLEEMSEVDEVGPAVYKTERGKRLREWQQKLKEWEKDEEARGRLKHKQTMQEGVLSLDKKIRRTDPETLQEYEVSLGELITDDSRSSLDLVSNVVLRGVLNQLLDQLNPRERLILVMRFGLKDGHSIDIDEIGEILGCSRDRVKQVEAKALKKLRHPSRTRPLLDYLD